MQYTGKGDQGYTSLYGGERTAKDAPRIEALGSLDEANSAIGFARSSTGREETRVMLLRVQRELYCLMAEVASPEPGRLTQRVNEEMTAALEADIAAIETDTPLPNEFIIPGDTPGGAAFDLARAVTRRAERAVVKLVHQGEIENAQVIRYLNRLSSLLYILARAEDSASGKPSSTMEK